MIIGIDPGIERCGVAVLRAGRLAAAGLPKAPATRGEGEIVRVAAVAQAVVDFLISVATAGELSHACVTLEWPRIYLAGKSKAPGADILLLSAVDGAIAGRLAPYGCELASIPPDRWKGQTKDNVMAGRIVGRLDDAECRLLADVMQPIAQGLRHNVTDAVGIALWAAGRLKPSLGDSAPDTMG